MSKPDFLRSVEKVRHHLTTLRAQLENRGKVPEFLEAGPVLVELQDVLEGLQAHFALMRDVLARTNDVVFAKDLDGRYLMINANGSEMFGKAVEDIVGQDDTALFPPETAKRVMAIDREILRTGTTRTFEETLDVRGVSTTLLTAETVWYEPVGTLRGLIGTMQDVTKRRRYDRDANLRQERLRSLASEIVIAEERLRQSLAAELHNGLGQDIALAKMKLAALRRSVSAELHDPLERIEHLVEQADRALRSITFQICPPSLHDLGLLPALEWLAEDIGDRNHIEVTVADDGTPLVEDERMRVVLFRAVRELLVNAAAHSGARTVRVRLRTDETLLHLIVQDDGSGFDATRIDSDGYGLFGMREQMRHVGGNLRIDSERGRGTTVELTAPLLKSRALSD
jgi:PAS domain S-box-containing protein